MSAVTNSAYLEKILSDMKKYNTEKSGGKTIEKFILALTDSIYTGSGADVSSMNSEQVAIYRLFSGLNLDIAAFRKMLIQKIENEDFMADVLFQMRMADAKKEAGKAEKTTLSAFDLLAAIFLKPSDSLQDILIAAKGKKADGNNSFADIVSEKKSEKEAGKESPKDAKETPEDTLKYMSDLVDKTNRIQKVLSENIFGQNKAINTFAAGYFQAKMLSLTDKERTRPKATFLFAGPPGVGKTFLAETAAHALGLPYKRFDMSEYCDKEASVEFIGSDSVYRNAKGGNFTSFVSENPESVVLFDEIEKAHISIIHLFLQILDAGRIRDSNSDREIELTNTIMIFTTNAGKQLYENSDTEDLSGISRKVVLKALQNDKDPHTGQAFFPAAICSRFASGNVVMFNHIKAHNLCEIAKKEFVRHCTNFEKESGVTIRFDENIFTTLLFAEGGAADARTVRSRTEAFFNDELFELFRLINSQKVTTGISDLKEISFSTRLPDDKEFLSLYQKSDDKKVLVFSNSEVFARCRKQCDKISFVNACTVDAAERLLNQHEIEFILLDLSVGVHAESNYLNWEDVDSDSRDFLHLILHKYNSLPIYVLQSEDNMINEEEKQSFLNQGVRGFISVTDGSMAKELDYISECIHQQNSIAVLAKSNRVVTYETAQKLYDNGSRAEITLFDFKLNVALDSDDADSVLGENEKPNVHFDDVIGSEDAKSELQYYVTFLKNPKGFLSKGLKTPRGVLLYGPPGTGKTMLAKAMACESDVTFISAEGNQFLKKYIGEGPEKVHELFKTARKYAPSILFIDEIDAIAKERTGGDHTGGVEATLTAFLAEMDGFKNDVSKPVFVLAATNFEVTPGSPKSLDQAFLRRFDRRIYVDLPTKEERARYIKAKIASNSAYHLSNEKIENLITRSTGMSIAELESVFEMALRNAVKTDECIVTDAIFDEAFETFNSGEKKEWDDSQLERVARHESGHAFLCWLNGETPSYLTIVARGNHGGYMQHADNEGKAIYTKKELLDRIVIALGGRAAEIVYYGREDGISTGPSGDLQTATAIAKQLICTYGMDPAMGLAVISKEDLFSDSIAATVRSEVNKILSELMEKAIEMIEEHRACIDALVEVLLKKSHISGSEIDAILSEIMK